MSNSRNRSFAKKILAVSVIGTISLGVILISFSYFLQSKILLETLKKQTSEITQNWSKELKLQDIEEAKKSKEYSDPAERKLTEYFDLLSKYNPNVAQGYIFGTELEGGNKTSIVAVPSHLVKPLEDGGIKVGDMYEQPKEIAKSVQAMLQTKKVTFTNVYKDDYGTWMTILYPIKDKNNQISCYFGVDVDASVIDDGQNKLIKNSILTLLIFLILIILTQQIIIKRTLSPINELLKGINKVSNGNFDVELKAGNDELGRLNANFNIMTDKIKEMVLKVKNSSHKIDEFSKELLAITEENNNHVAKITNDIQEMATGIETQEYSTVESAHAMSEIAAGVQTIANSASNVSCAAIEMESKATKGNDVIQKVVDQMNLISDAVQNAALVIKTLDERSREINSIMSVITDISGQTNLLALNATIEAARAGEHGRGFAVVADEVRKLAEQSKNSAEHIVELVQIIQNETTNAVNSMDKGSKEVHLGMEIVKQTGDLFLEIVNTTRDVASQIQDVSSSSQQISSTTEEMTATVNDLTSIAKQTTSVSNNIASNVKLQQNSVESIVSASKQLNLMSEELEELVSSFQV